MPPPARHGSSLNERGRGMARSRILESNIGWNRGESSGNFETGFRRGVSPNNIENYSTSLRFPPPLPLSQGHAVVVRIDPSTGLATFEGFLLSFYLVDRSDLISSPCITTLISHDFQLGRYFFSRAERAKETSRDPPPYRIFYLYELDSSFEKERKKEKRGKKSLYETFLYTPFLI